MFSLCYPQDLGKPCVIVVYQLLLIYIIISQQRKVIIIVISPLTALIKDQVSNLLKRGIGAGYVDADSSKEVKNGVNKGRYNILFMSPELLVSKWRSLFVTSIYQRRLVGMIIDEAHCVVKW